MGEESKLYDWAAYYESACERERKQNNMRAVKIAEAESRQEELDTRLNRILSHPFWKLSAPFRKLYHNMQGERTAQEQTPGLQEGDAALTYYREEIRRQKQPYLQWIEEREKNSDRDFSSASAVEQLSGDGIWRVPVPNSDVILVGYGKGMLDGGAFAAVRSWFENNEACLLAYADEDFYFENITQRMYPWFKPCYSPDTLLSFNYFGHMAAIRRSLAGKVKINTSLALPVRFYDLILRLEEAAGAAEGIVKEKLDSRIQHIGGVLYHNLYEPTEAAKEKLAACSVQEERFLTAQKCLEEEMGQGNYLVGAGSEFNAMKEEAFVRRGIRATMEPGPNPDIFHVSYNIVISGRDRCVRAQSSLGAINPQLFVSVVIPSKDQPKALENCIRSFVLMTAYENYEFIVVDNGSSEENVVKVRDELPVRMRKECRRSGKRKEFRFTYVYEPMPFNFSKMCNLGVERANGDLILLLNDDVEIIEKDWLTRMVGQAIQPHTGAVGAKLWYAGTETIQHAGITNLRIGPSHKLITFPDDRDYYYGHNRVTYDVIGVTAACLLVSKEKYQKAGGLDESMEIAYNDVDFCFKLYEAGYYNILRNDAVLYHHESLSRGLDEQDDMKWERLLDEKAKLYEKHPQLEEKDAFYHEDLIDNASDYSCNYKFPHADHLHTVKPEALQPSSLRGAKQNRLKLTVDRAEMQHKIHKQEPDIVWIMGWCYVPGADNAGYDKKVILKKSDEKGYMAVPADWHREDVEKILPEECHVGLAGFVLRVEKADLEPGEYQIGMLCTERAGQKSELAWSEITIVIA